MHANGTESLTPARVAFDRAGLSQKFAADLMGISYSKLCRIVNGQCRVSRDDKRSIALFLRLPVDEVFPDEAGW
jgi:transcriptional regulator with XRE-family HTH domain